MQVNTIVILLAEEDFIRKSFILQSDGIESAIVTEHVRNMKNKEHAKPKKQHCITMQSNK